jgi:hypothetical protein
MGDERTRRTIIHPTDGRTLGCTEHFGHAAIASETRPPLHRRLDPRPAGREAGRFGRRCAVPEAEDVMTTMDLEILTPTERDEIAGFGVSLARKLAARFDVDLHLAVDLVANGCPPELAARILL